MSIPKLLNSYSDETKLSPDQVCSDTMKFLAEQTYKAKLTKRKGNKAGGLIFEPVHIKNLKEYLGITYFRMSQLIGVRERQLQRWKRGDAHPSVKHHYTLNKLAAVTGYIQSVAPEATFYWNEKTSE